MKLTLAFLLFATSFIVYGKATPGDFSAALLSDVQKEIKKDDESYKKAASRGPASVKPQIEPVIEDVPKIDKNVRQIGPNRW